MTNPDGSRHIEVGDGGEPVPAAEVTTSAGAEGTDGVAACAAGHITPGSASPVDAHGTARGAGQRARSHCPAWRRQSLERLRSGPGCCHACGWLYHAAGREYTFERPTGTPSGS